MPRTRSLAWSELKIGVLTIAAIAITAALIFSLTGGRGFFWQRYMLKTRCPDAAGLSAGSPVRVAGVQVGSVQSVALNGEQVEVVFDLNKSVRDKVTDKSTAVMGSVSLLGQSSVDITPATTGNPIPEWGYVPLGHIKGQLADVADQASSGIDQITRLVADVRAGRGTVGKLMTDDRLYTDLQQFVGAANEMARSVRAGKGTVGKLLNDPKSAQALEASLKNVEAITERINAGDGSLGKLLKDEAFANSLSAATANLRQITDKINHGDGTVGKLMTDAALYNKINSVTARLDDLVTKLNEGQGTAGLLLKDKQLYENMNKAVGELTALITAIKQDPKKYLNVKVSIF
jgi:phospholipid/cholesterol/gamma-HCH transport system substrate-binding protein